MRDVSQLPILDHSRTPTPPQIPTNYCMTNTPRILSQAPPPQQQPVLEQARTSRDLECIDLNNRAKSAGPKIIIRRTKKFQEPQESFATRDGRFGSNWRHVKQITSHTNVVMCTIDGPVKERDNEQFPPKLYSPAYVTEELLERGLDRPLLVNRRKGKPTSVSWDFNDANVKEKRPVVLPIETVKDETSTRQRDNMELNKNNNSSIDEPSSSSVSENETEYVREKYKPPKSSLYLNIDLRGLKDNINSLKLNVKENEWDYKVADSSSRLLTISSNRVDSSPVRVKKLIEDLGQTFLNISSNILVLKDNFEGNFYFEKVSENIVNFYDYGSKCEKIRENHRQILKTLDKSTIRLFKHIDQVFASAQNISLSQTIDFRRYRTSLFPIGTDLNLLDEVYHFKFYNNLGKILLKNIEFGRLLYFNDFSLIKKLNYYHLFDSSNKKGKRVMKLLNLKNEI